MSKNINTWTVADVKAEIVRMDKALKGAENDRSFKTAVILLSSLIVGPNIKKLAKFTGYTPSEIQPRAKNLRENGVWVGSKIKCEWFEKDGGVAFWADTLVADGLLNRH